MTTKEQILKCFKDINHAYNDCTRYDTLKCMLDELQEPCEDAISRQAVLDLINADWKYEGLEEPINSLPPVNQFKPICCPSMGIDCENCPAYEKKTGHWIDHEKHIECDSCSVWFLKDRLIRKSFCPNCGAKMTESEQKPKSEWEHDHEILKAYSDGANAVLESLIEQYEHYLELLDADMKDGSATIVTKTKYAVYTEVVEQLKEVLESEGKA